MSADMNSCAIYSDIVRNKYFRHVDKSRLVYFNGADLDRFLSCDAVHKIAVIEVKYSDIRMTVELLDKILHCDHVFVYSMEFTKVIVEPIIKKYDRLNFTFVVNGFANFEMQKAKIIPIWTWLQYTASLYLDQLSHELDLLLPFANKPMEFDVMVGRYRTHRKFVVDWIKNSESSTRYFQTPFFDLKLGVPSENYHVDNLDYWEDGIIMHPPDRPNTYQCYYHGILMNISQVLPVKIYNQTAYSLVCETEYSNDYTFFTEKTAKPIIACRLFVMIAGQYYLRNLRKIGFRTFDSVIDESYDLEPDPETRWKMALEQCDWLCKQDQRVILDKIKPTVLHNFNMLFKLSPVILENQVELFLLQNGYYKK